VIYGIQILRGLAAVMVVFAHVQPQLDHFGGPALTWLAIGGSGVDIFFVISGFIIWVTSQSERMTVGTFLVRRAIRIVPLYWLATAVLASVALLVPAAMSSTKFDLSHVLASFAFIPYRHPVLSEIYPILVPGWSLNYEAFFYFLFGIGLLFADRLATLYAVFGALMLLTLGGFIFHPAAVPISYYTDPIVMEFAFGLCVGVLYTHGRKFPLWLGLAAIPLGFAAILGCGWAGLVDNHDRVLIVGLPAALLVWGVTVAKRHQVDPGLPLLVALGDASYSIYLTHVMTLPVGARLWGMIGLGYQGWRLALFIAVEVLSAIAVGWVVHRLVEQPMLGYLRARFEPRKRVVAVTARH
jgi:exopolysaccharide production protein ExoZ